MSEPNPPVKLRPGEPDDCAHLAAVEARADRRYDDTHLAGLGTSEGIPTEAALRYVERGRLHVATSGSELVGFIAWHAEDEPDYLGIPWDERVWMIKPL